MSMRGKFWVGLASASAGVLFLPPAVSAADAAWAVKAAPYRVVVRSKAVPSDAETGTEIQVPDLGATGVKGGDFALVDAAGAPVPAAVVWQGEGQDTLLLASGMQAGQDYYLYIGGPRGATWTPKTSLLFETRGLAPGHAPFTSSGSIQDSWKTAPHPGREVRARDFFGQQFVRRGKQFPFAFHRVPRAAGGRAGTLHEQLRRLVRAARRAAVRRMRRATIRSTDQQSGGASKEAAGFERPDPRGLLSGQDRRRPAGDDVWGGFMNGRPGTIPADSRGCIPARATVVRCEDVRGRPVPAMRTSPLLRTWGSAAASFTRLHCRLLPTALKDAPVEWRL